MATDREYYDILGVDKNATPDEIKRKYRELVKKHHPDLNKNNPDASQKMKEINEAYDVLSDPEKKKLYDQFGKAGVQGGYPGAGDFRGANFQGGFGEDIFSGFEDIFDFFTGSFVGRERARKEEIENRGRDLRYDLSISLEEAVFGAEKEIIIRKLERCDVCSGSGAQPGTKAKQCSTCGGTGYVKQVQNTIFGRISTTVVCPTCRGEGEIIEKPCSTCKGSGVLKKDKKLVIKIPQGIESGIKIRISGEGDAGERKGTPGDLYIYVIVKEHPLFKKSGVNLIYELKIPVVDAVLGTTARIPLLESGNESLIIPAGTQYGAEFLIKGKGGYSLSSKKRGDLKVIVKVVIPSKLTKEEKVAYEKIKNL